MSAQVKTKRNEDLVVGDVMHLWCGVKRIVRIEPYKGPLGHIIFAIAYWSASSGISLDRGGETEVVALPEGVLLAKEGR